MPHPRARKLCPKLVVLSVLSSATSSFSHMCWFCYDSRRMSTDFVDEGYFRSARQSSKPAADIARVSAESIRTSLRFPSAKGWAPTAHQPDRLESSTNAAFIRSAAAGIVLPPSGIANRFVCPGLGPQNGHTPKLGVLGRKSGHSSRRRPLEFARTVARSTGPYVFPVRALGDDRLLVPALEPQKSFRQHETFAELTDDGLPRRCCSGWACPLFSKVREEEHSHPYPHGPVRYNDWRRINAARVSANLPILETYVYGAAASPCCRAPGNGA